jgi:hypothetical protein
MRKLLTITALVLLWATQAQAATTVRATSSATGASGTALSVSAPTGTTTGDVVIVIAHVNNEEFVEDNNGATPFTEDLAEYQNDFTLHGLSIFSRRIQSGDPSTYNFTIGSSQRWTLVAIALQNPHATDIYDVAPSSGACATADVSDGNGNVVPSITTLTSGALHFSVAGFDGTVGMSSSPSGYTVLHQSGDETIGVGYKLMTSAISTGTTTWVDDADAGELSCSFSVKDSATLGTTLTLCASGCTYTATMANLNAAIVAASPGDTILLQAGALFTGTMVLRQKAGASYITIKTGVDDDGDVLSDSVWPSATTRLIPPSYTNNTNESGQATNYSGSLARLVPVGDANESTVRTIDPAETGSGCASAPCIAHHYRLELLDISGAKLGDAAPYGIIVALGSQQTSGGVPSGDVQDTAAEEPHHFVLDRVYVHGTDNIGCVHGVMQAARSVTIQNSYISNCWNGAQDAQAVWTINSTEGLTMINNYVEGGGENYLAGGDTPRMNFGGSAGITLSASSTTSATLTAALPDYMRIGDCVAVLISAAKWEACISNIQDSGGSRRLISFSNTLHTAPDVPGKMTGNVVPRGFLFSGNWFNTPLAWKGTAKDARKNIFELKIGRDVVVTGNLFTNSWASAQTGGAILFTPLNDNGFEDSAQLANITFSYNRIQNATVCFVINGTTSFSSYFTPRTDGVAISHTSCENIDSVEWGFVSPDSLPGITMTVGGHTPLRQFPKNVSFDHIYLDHQSGSSAVNANSDATTAPQVAATLLLANFVLKNSIIRNPSGLGFYDNTEYEAHASGDASWNAVISGGTCLNNSWANETSGEYTVCTGSFFPVSNAAQDALLTDYVGGDFAVLPSGAYNNAASDGTDLGPDWVELLRLTDAARSGTDLGAPDPPDPPDPPPVGGGGEELTIVNIYSPSATDLTLAPDSDLVLSPTGADVLPSTGYTVNMGRLTRKYLTLHAAELWVETLVAQNTMATIGGRIIVAPTNILSQDLPIDNTSMAVKYNNMAIGDIVMLEAAGLVEFMAITGGPSGSDPYIYSMTRNLDGSGANAWSAGDAVLNTGQSGNGFIDLYSVRGARRTTYVDGTPLSSATEIGPSIVFNQRTSSTYNAWSPRAAIGNLDGLYGYSGSVYGSAFGVPGGARLLLDPTNGIRLYGGDNDLKVEIDASGNATFDGSITVGTGRNQIRNSTCDVSTDDWAIFSNHGNGTTFSFAQPGFSLNQQSNTCFVTVTGTPTAATVTNMYNTTYMPVTEGLKYEASAYVGLQRATSAITNIVWYDAAGSVSGTPLSVSAGNTCTTSSAGGPLLSSFCRSVVIATAPSTAVTARVQVSMTHNGTQADPYLFVVRSYFGDAALTQEDPTPWGAAGTTSINNGLIQTDAIDARVISANSITASELAANSVTAVDILSNTITSAQIAAGTITATEIASGTITADRLNVGSLSAISADLGTVTAGSMSAVSINGGTISGTTISGVTVVGSSSISGATISGGSIDINGGAFEVQSNGNTFSTALTNTGTITTAGFLADTFFQLVYSGFTAAGNHHVCHDNSGVFFGGAACDAVSPSMIAVRSQELRMGAELAELREELAELRAELAAMRNERRQ